MRTEIVVEAPGRINLIGEHTDYNEGFVLPGAIDKTIQQRIKVNGSETSCRLNSAHFNESIYIDLNKVTLNDKSWANYLIGILVEIKKDTDKLSGFDCSFNGNIPLGGGVSSSSALQVSFIFALNELFELGYSKIEMAKICQAADHNFIGMRGGIMDQFTILHGQADQLMLLDCRSLEHKFYPVSFGDYQLLLLNTNVAHSLADTEYNTRRAECEAGVELLKASHPDIISLRDVSLAQLAKAQDLLSPVIYNRCHHVITENQRTLQAAKLLQQGNVEALGKLIYHSHNSLRHAYEVSCEELDFLVDYSSKLDYVAGCRMMGGGFGGCTIGLVNRERREEYISLLSEAYEDRFTKDLTPLEVELKAGARILEK